MSHTPACPPSSLSRRLGPLALAGLVLLLAAGCTAFARAVREGDEFTAQRQWAQAEASYQRALAVDPRDSEVLLKLRAMRRQWSDEVLEQARALHAEGDLGGATPLLVRALELEGDNDAARELLGGTLEARVEGALGKLKEEKLVEARAELEAVLAVDGEHAAARRGVDGVKRAWARRWFATGQRLEGEGKPGNALLAYVRADQERVGATAARERAAAVRRQLQDEIAFVVVAAPAEDKAQAPDVAQRLGPGRLAALLPREVPIRVITEEPPPGQVGVRLGVSLERVVPVKTVEASQRSQRYVVTNRSVPSPRRGELEGALLEAERTLEEVERRLGGAVREYLRRQAELTQARETARRCRDRERKVCHEALIGCGRAASQGKPGQVPPECNPAQCNVQCAEEEGALGQRASGAAELERKLEGAQEAAEVQRREVQRARDAYYREPPTLEEPVYGEYPYDVELHRLTVMASVTERLVDLTKAGAVPSPRTGDYAAAHEDLAHKGYEKVGVLADPVQLRSEVELRVEAGDRAMEAIAERVKARFEAYRQRRVEDARRGMVRPSAEEVVEEAVRALLLTADAPPQDILLPLAQARGLENPEALFGR